MLKIKEIGNILKFYMEANSLKINLQSDKSTYSVADNIYGAFILAVLYCEKSTEKVNLKDILTMIILSEMQEKNSFYNVIDTMQEKEVLLSYIAEYQDSETMEAMIAKNCKKYDKIFTNIIDYIGNYDVNDEEKCQEFIKIASKEVHVSKEKVEDLLRFYYLNHKLKLTVRTGWDKKHWNIVSRPKRVERISEHIVSTFATALAFLTEFKYELDEDYIFQTIVMHEIGEIFYGDKTPFEISKEQKNKEERECVKKVLENLTINKEILIDLDLLVEGKDKNAKFVHFCDKIEADLQSKVYYDRKMHHSLADQRNNIAFNSPKVQKMMNYGLITNVFDVWYYYDRGIYFQDDDFKEFFDTLNIARSNDLTKLNFGIIKETIELTDLETNFLINEISEIIKKLKENSFIEGILFSKYQNDLKGNIVLTIFTNREPNADESENLTRKFASINITNIPVTFEFLPTYKLSFPRTIEQFHLREQFLNGEIIYDRNGLLNNRIGDLKKNLRTYYYNNYNLVEYVPPIDKEIKRLTK